MTGASSHRADGARSPRPPGRRGTRRAPASSSWMRCSSLDEHCSPNNEQKLTPTAMTRRPRGARTRRAAPRPTATSAVRRLLSGCGASTRELAIPRRGDVGDVDVTGAEPLLQHVEEGHVMDQELVAAASFGTRTRPRAPRRSTRRCRGAAGAAACRVAAPGVPRRTRRARPRPLRPLLDSGHGAPEAPVTVVAHAPQIAHGSARLLPCSLDAVSPVDQTASFAVSRPSVIADRAVGRRCERQACSSVFKRTRSTRLRVRFA